MARIQNWHINLVIFIFLIAIVFLVIANIELASDIQQQQLTQNGNLEVHFIDVGQANATLLKGQDFVVLVDAGDFRNDDVVPYLAKLDIKEIDLLVGSHPHADHIGQFDKVLDSFIVHEVWMSGDDHTTRTFERAIDALSRSIERNKTSYHEPKRGEVFNIGSLQIEILNPQQLTGDFHTGSIALRAIYGDFSVMITGDVEVEIEHEIIADYAMRAASLNSTVLELGHHGSRTSSSVEFLQAVAPQLAVYSAGIDNDYGHPHLGVVDRVKDMGISLFGTAENGTIIIVSDGRSYELLLEHE